MEMEEKRDFNETEELAKVDNLEIEPLSDSDLDSVAGGGLAGTNTCSTYTCSTYTCSTYTCATLES
jgi:hypothetical protein